MFTFGSDSLAAPPGAGADGCLPGGKALTGGLGLPGSRGRAAERADVPGCCLVIGAGPWCRAWGAGYGGPAVSWARLGRRRLRGGGGRPAGGGGAGSCRPGAEAVGGAGVLTGERARGHKG